jgi:hypothetical protein
MHDEIAYKDRLDASNVEEGIQALVDSRTRPLPGPALRRLAASADRPAVESPREDITTLDIPPPEASPPPTEPDYVNHPPHYTAHPSKVECITITEWMNFNIGNAVKYLWRSGEKGFEIQDLKKARWYIDREIARLEKLRDGA